MSELSKSPAGTAPVVLHNPSVSGESVTIRCIEQLPDHTYKYSVTAPTLPEAIDAWNGAMYVLKSGLGGSKQEERPKVELTVPPSLRERILLAVINLAASPSSNLSQIQVLALTQQFEDYVLGKLEAPTVEWANKVARNPNLLSAEEALAHPEEDANVSVSNGQADSVLDNAGLGVSESGDERSLPTPQV